MKEKWRNFAEDHKNIMEFMKFFIISNGVTVLQMILMRIPSYRNFTGEECKRQRRTLL